MSMSRAELINAIREGVSKEFENIPCESEIEYSFSQKFEDKMHRLINAQKRTFWNWTNTVGKRVAIIVVCLITLFGASMSVSAIREPFIEFVKQIFSDHNEYTVTGATKDEIEYKYTLGYIPDGYVQTEYSENSISVDVDYEKSKFDLISFSQNASKYYFMTLDNEHGKVYTINLRNTDVSIYESDDVVIAFWVEDGYVFRITYYSGNIETLKQMVLSVK